jgi:hypothetical protein
MSYDACFQAPFLRFSAYVTTVADKRFIMSTLSGVSCKRREPTGFNGFSNVRSIIRLLRVHTSTKPCTNRTYRRFNRQ